MNEPLILGIGYKVAVGVGVGAAIGSVLGDGKWWERCLRGVAGAAASYVGHHVAAMISVGFLSIVTPHEYLPSVAEMEPVAALFIGLVGMVACQAAINAVTTVADVADDIVIDRLRRDHDRTHDRDPESK